MGLDSLQSAYSFANDKNGYIANENKNVTRFIYNSADQVTAAYRPGFTDLGYMSPFDYKRAGNEFAIGDQGTATRVNQLGIGTRFPLGPKGQIHEFDIKRTGFSPKRTYSSIYKSDSNAGLANTYTLKSPIDDMYNIVKVRDVASRRAYAREPFILRGIQRDDNSKPQRWGPTITADLPAGGLVTSLNRQLNDVGRIGKFLITPKGLLFMVKQFTQQLMNPNVEGVTGQVGTILNPNSTKLYTPINMLANVVGAPFGIRTRRHGLLPFGSAFSVEGKYEDVITNRQAPLVGKGTDWNRLVQVGGELGLLDGIEPFGMRKGSKLADAINKGADKLRAALGFKGQVINTLTGITGPKSVGGVGRTTISRTSNTRDIPKIDENTGHLPDSTVVATDLEKRPFRLFKSLPPESGDEGGLVKLIRPDGNGIDTAFDGVELGRANSRNGSSYAKHGFGPRDDNYVPTFDKITEIKDEDGEETSEYRWNLIPDTPDQRKDNKKQFIPNSIAEQQTSKIIQLRDDDDFNGITDPKKSDKVGEKPTEYISDFKSPRLYIPENEPAVPEDIEILKLSPAAKAITYRALTYPNIKSITKARTSNSTKILDYGRTPDTSKENDGQYEFEEPKTRLYQTFEEIKKNSSSNRVKSIWNKLELPRTVDETDDKTTQSYIDFEISRNMAGTDVKARFKAYITSWSDDIGQTAELVDQNASGVLMLSPKTQSTSRSMNISFFAAATSAEEMTSIYSNLHKLKQIVGTTRKNKSKKMSRVKMGKILTDHRVTLESLSTSWNSEYSWDITPTVQSPMILDVSIDFIFTQANKSVQYEFGFKG